MCGFLWLVLSADCAYSISISNLWDLASYFICSSANAIMQQEVIMRETADHRKIFIVLFIQRSEDSTCRIRYRSPVGPL